MSGCVRIVVVFWILSIVSALGLAGDSLRYTAEGGVLGPDGQAVYGFYFPLLLYAR